MLNLSRRIGDIFESSELEEKRAILSFLLQNPVVEDKKLEFSILKPFDTVLELAGCPVMLRIFEAMRTWYAENDVIVPVPDLQTASTLEQI